VCGNGSKAPTETCDGADLGGASCGTQGFFSGTLSCNANCQGFNTAACTNCGNGAINGGEVCDGANLNGPRCASQGFGGGTLSCNAGCASFNTASCNSGDCCTDNGYAGCQVASIESCVCILDSYCCSNFWDDICVDEAINDCGASC